VLVALAVGLVVTIAYHLPLNFRIWSMDRGEEWTRVALRRWLGVHVLRVLSGLATGVLAAVAMVR
jgi:cytochrome bd-type quinol oxidase subunit 1